VSKTAIAEPEIRSALVTHRTNEKDSISVEAFALGLTACFFLLELVNILHHAMWRDEMQVYTLSQHSHSLIEFLRLKRYEDIGHPDGWHLLFYPVSRFTSNPISLQLLHMTLATMTAYVIARYSPFSRLQKTLMVFGYFLFFEYATISHDYALGVFAVFAYCAVFRAGPRKNYLLLAALCALMAESNVYALMLGLSFALAICFEAIRSRKPLGFFRPNLWQARLGAALFGIVTLASVFRMRAPVDSGFVRPWHFPVDATGMGRTIAMMWKVFVPVPELTRQFWNTNIVSGPLLSILSVAVLCVSILFFVRKPVILFTYCCGLGELLLFRHGRYAGFLRNDGHAFILFLACMWLAHQFPEDRLPFPKLQGVAEWFEGYRRPVFLTLLIVQVVVAVIASAIAFKVPFSEAKVTAEFLQSKNMDQMFIIGEPDAPLATLSGYLHRDIFYLRGNRMGSYIVWDGERGMNPKQTALQLGAQKAQEQRADVLVILNRPAPALDARDHEIASFTGSITGSEDYYIYLVSYEQQKELSESR